MQRSKAAKEVAEKQPMILGDAMAYGELLHQLLWYEWREKLTLVMMPKPGLSENQIENADMKTKQRRLAGSGVYR